MKKILVITTLFCISLGSNIYAQCTPDAAIVAAGLPGIFPTPVEGIATGIDGNAYAQTFTIIVPSDTTIDPSVFVPGVPSIPVQLTINSSTINSVNGLPSGLNYTCATSCTYAGGTTDGCFIVDGTPTQSGTFLFQVNVTLNAELPAFPPLFAGGPTDAPAQDIEYTLTIDPVGTIDIQKVEEGTFEVYPVTPNPSNGGAEIRFYTPDYRSVNLTIHNLIGAIVVSEQIYAEQGMNSLSIDSDKLSSGVYVVTLSDGANTSTKRMVVAPR